MIRSSRWHRSLSLPTANHSARSSAVRTTCCSGLSTGAVRRSKVAVSSVRSIRPLARAARQASRRAVTVSQRSTACGSATVSALRTKVSQVFWTTSSAVAVSRP